MWGPLRLAPINNIAISLVLTTFRLFTTNSSVWDSLRLATNYAPINNIAISLVLTTFHAVTVLVCVHVGLAQGRTN